MYKANRNIPKVELKDLYLTEGLNNSLCILRIECFLCFSYLLSKENASITFIIRTSFLLLRVCVVVVFVKLFYKVFNNLINRDVENLNVASRAAGDNRSYSIKIFESLP